MQSRSLRTAVLCWVAAFFIVVVPGHRRGLVQLPGHNAAATQTTSVSKAYCPLCVMLPPGSEGGVPADAPVNCAVCFLKANLDAPPDVVLPPVFYEELVFLLTAQSVGQDILVSAQHRILGRAPPIAI